MRRESTELLNCTAVFQARCMYARHAIRAYDRVTPYRRILILRVIRTAVATPQTESEMATIYDEQAAPPSNSAGAGAAAGKAAPLPPGAGGGAADSSLYDYGAVAERYVVLFGRRVIIRGVEVAAVAAALVIMLLIVREVKCIMAGGGGTTPGSPAPAADKSMFMGCFHDCGTTSEGHTMDRVCDDMRTTVTDIQTCKTTCAAYTYMGLACPMSHESHLTTGYDEGFECWCCNELDHNSNARVARIPDTECFGGHATSGLNGNTQGHCDGYNGDYTMSGYGLGGWCRASIYAATTVPAAAPAPAPAVWAELGEQITDYPSAGHYCSSQGKALCCYDNYCPDGQGTAPFGGRRDGDEWAATRDGANWW